jgi:hypothetical protein
MNTDTVGLHGKKIRFGQIGVGDKHITDLRTPVRTIVGFGHPLRML